VCIKTEQYLYFAVQQTLEKMNEKISLGVDQNGSAEPNGATANARTAAAAADGAPFVRCFEKFDLGLTAGSS